MKEHNDGWVVIMWKKKGKLKISLLVIEFYSCATIDIMYRRRPVGRFVQTESSICPWRSERSSSTFDDVQ